ncbi:MAG: WG repeat-containing protein [Cyanobacteria bacterium HKST-UBA02]|nr:WG repeat-containing protein [Cyanobacteria bacterium HKST-UBA02]
MAPPTAHPRYGVIRTTGEEVVPFSYFDITRLNNGDFAARLFDCEDTTRSPAGLELFDRAGRPISLNRIPKELKPESASGNLVVVSARANPDKFGVCTRAGKIVLEPEFDHIVIFPRFIHATSRFRKNAAYSLNGKPLLISDSRLDAPKSHKDANLTRRDLIPFRTGSGLNKKWGYKDRSGKTIIPPQFAYADPFNEFGLATVISNFDDERIHMGLIDKTGNYLLAPRYADIKIVDSMTVIASTFPPYHFSALDWRSYHYRAYEGREKEFYALLRDHNLIGMDRQRLISLLGLPDYSDETGRIYYSIRQGQCFFSTARGIAIDCPEGKVKRWRWQKCFETMEGPKHWYQEDVLFKTTNEYKPVRWPVPKYTSPESKPKYSTNRMIRCEGSADALNLGLSETLNMDECRRVLATDANKETIILSLSKRVLPSTEAQLKDFAKALGYKKVIVNRDRAFFEEEPKIIDAQVTTVPLMDLGMIGQQSSTSLDLPTGSK